MTCADDTTINRVAVVNLLVRAHEALRSVDATFPGYITTDVVDRVTDAIAAIEEFARERGIAEIRP